VAINAEWMIDSIDSLSPAISKEWIALILLPTVGSLAGKSRFCPTLVCLTSWVAECITATNVSVEDQLTLSISVAVGSTIVRHTLFVKLSYSLTESLLANGTVRDPVYGSSWMGT
jgi:Ca2+/H+ antiporter